MQGTMKAYYYESANNAAIRDLPVPQISDDEVLVKIKAVGICHTDLSVLAGINIVPVPFPFIGGHEWSGEIVETGKDVVAFKVGDRVVGECNSGCGSCLACQEGHEDYCMVAPVQRGINTDGAFCEYYRIISRMVHRIPDDMDWITASLMEPFTVAYTGIYGIGSCDAGDTVVVQGGGAIGLSAVAAAAGMGARVILSDSHQSRRDMAMKLGAYKTINRKTEDVVKIVSDMTDGFGADLVVEAAGNAASMKQSLDLVRNNGRIAYLGMDPGTEIPVEIGKFMMKGIRAQGSLGSPGIWDRAIRFVARSGIDLKMLSSKQFPFVEAGEAFEYTRNRDNEFVKVTLLTE